MSITSLKYHSSFFLTDHDTVNVILDVPEDALDSHPIIAVGQPNPEDLDFIGTLPNQGNQASNWQSLNKHLSP